MEAIGAVEAFVLAAIPEAGRTTVGGVQLADGVPVDRTAFASDPENPVREARVARAIEATGARRAGVVELAALRGGDVDGSVERVRASGASVVVVDAESSADLARAVAAILRRPGPHLLVGSTGLARALRDAVAGAAPDADTAAVAAPAAGGVLTIVGSAHPVARSQVACVRERGLATIAEADGAGVGERAARAIARGEHVVVVAPARSAAGGVLDALARVSAAATRIARPGGLVLVGGETAQRVLAGLGVEALRVEGAPAPLVVRSRAMGGALAGLRVVTNGG